MLTEIEAWTVGGEWPRLWAMPLVALAYAREGDFERARRHLDSLLGTDVYRGRQLEARGALIAEEGTWDEAASVAAAAREHGEVARLAALPLHADRLEGRAALATGDAEAAIAPLERAAAGFAGLHAAWEAALCRAGTRRGARGSRSLRGRRHGARARGRGVRALRVPRELDRARALLGTVARAD